MAAHEHVLVPDHPPPDPASLSTMLELRDPHRHAWDDRELRDMLRHQLAAPLQLSLGTLSAEVAHQLRRAQPPLDPQLTLGQLLLHSHPPVELLKLVKRFAKICRSDPENPLPSGLVMLMYYASVAVAWVKSGQRISALGVPAMTRGLGWLVEQSWVEGDVRALLTATRDGVAASGK